MRKINFENRIFKLWFYQVSHGEALIRSIKNEDIEMNIDIYFGGIQYIEIPNVLNDLQIAEANNEDLAYLSRKLGKEICIGDIKVLISSEKRFYIVSSVMKIMENKLEMFEVPFATFIKSTN